MVVKRVNDSNDFFTSIPNITKPTARVYLAQASLDDFPRALANDVPTPEAVLRAGKGDVYGASLWIGQAPTYTPLHRDPNPNVFVQLAGRKTVRIFEPHVGRGIFAKVQEQIGATASPTMRGEEMMQGEEKEALDREVWESATHIGDCYEAELDSGDGLFIPKGYWHSVKGVGEGMIGSVSSARHRLCCFNTDELRRSTGGSGSVQEYLGIERYPRQPAFALQRGTRKRAT